MRVDQAKRLKELEGENTRLRRILSMQVCCLENVQSNAYPVSGISPNLEKPNLPIAPELTEVYNCAQSSEPRTEREFCARSMSLKTRDASRRGQGSNIPRRDA